MHSAQVRTTERNGGTSGRAGGHIRGVVNQTVVALRAGVRSGCDDLRGRQRHHTRVEFQVNRRDSVVIYIKKSPTKRVYILLIYTCI